MTFTAIFLGGTLFFLGLAFHICWWRLRRPKDDIRALVASLLILPAVLALGALASQALPSLTGRETVGAILVVFAIGATYIMYYPAAQAASPTMLVVLKIARTGAEGIREADLLAAFDDDLLCREGIENLAHQRFAQDRNGRLEVAPRGALLLRMLDLWRRALGLNQGRG